MKRVFFVMLIAMISLGNSCSTKEAREVKLEKQLDKVILTGKIAVKGTEPHTWLSLTTSEGRDYKLSGELAGVLRKQFQQQVVTIEGQVTSVSKISILPSGFRVDRLVKTP